MKTPERYLPDNKQFEDKSWLYEQYWGELHGLEEIANRCNVSDQRISRALKEHGIPTRSAGWAGHGNPLLGFREVNESNETVDWGKYHD